MRIYRNIQKLNGILIAEIMLETPPHSDESQGQIQTLGISALIRRGPGAKSIWREECRG